MRTADLGGDLLEVVIRRYTESRCTHYARRVGDESAVESGGVRRWATHDPAGRVESCVDAVFDGAASPHLGSSCGRRQTTPWCDDGRHPRLAVGQTGGVARGIGGARAVFIE